MTSNLSNIRTHAGSIPRDLGVVIPNLSRRTIISVVGMILTLFIVIRLVYMNTFGGDFLKDQINARIERVIVTKAMRGTIVDRNNIPLAVSTPVDSIWASPADMQNLSIDDLNKLSNALGISVATLNTKLNQKDKTFVYLKRGVDPAIVGTIKSLNIGGVYSTQEFKRFYANGPVTAHVLGFDNIDDKGIAGIEYANNSDLTGHDGAYKIYRNPIGQVMENLGVITPAKAGSTITLALDSRIQNIAYSALNAQVNKLHAAGGSAIVLNAKTGEVLAMVNLPTYNPNNLATATADSLKNRADTNVYDPGSIMKPLIIAKALDDHKITPSTVFDTHPYRVGTKIIKDDEPFPRLDVTGILVHSSDIGTSKIGLMYKPYELWSYLRQLDFGSKLHTGFPGETTGVLLKYNKWRPMDQALMSFGYGIAVSLFQMAHAYTLFTNNGCILPVSFYRVDDGQPLQCKQLISNNTAATIRNILEQNTQVGTAQNAKTLDYTTAGKTGTAQKLINGHYSHTAHVGSFVGFAPANNPRIIVAVMIDSPKTAYYASTVAAPVFSSIVEPSLQVLGVSPDKVISHK